MCQGLYAYEPIAIIDIVDSERVNNSAFRMQPIVFIIKINYFDYERENYSQNCIDIK